MLRFTIRDVLWLTLLVALALGWALDHWRLGTMINLWQWRALTLAQYLEDGGAPVLWTNDGLELGEGPGGEEGVTVYTMRDR